MCVYTYYVHVLYLSTTPVLKTIGNQVSHVSFLGVLWHPPFWLVSHTHTHTHTHNVYLELYRNGSKLAGAYTEAETRKATIKLLRLASLTHSHTHTHTHAHTHTHRVRPTLYTNTCRPTHIHTHADSHILYVHVHVHMHVAHTHVIYYTHTHNGYLLYFSLSQDHCSTNSNT